MGKRGLSFRHLRAAVLHREDRDRTILAKQLVRLGLVVRCWDNIPRRDELRDIDVVFFDGDCGFENAPSGAPDLPDVPRIALVGAETPGRLEWILAREASAHLMKPIRNAGLYTALAMGFQQFESYARLRGEIDQLTFRIKSRKVLFSALLKVMETHGLDDEEAFRAIRDAAMRRRITVEAMSAQIVHGEDAGAMSLCKSVPHSA